MDRYLVVSGRTSKLCLAELQQILKFSSFSIYQQTIDFPVVALETKNLVNAEILISKSGGIIKIAKVIGILNNLDVAILAKLIGNKSKSVVFGISIYSPSSYTSQKLSTLIKNQLTQTGIKVRYILPKEGQVLSSAAVFKQPIAEYILWKHTDTQKWWLAQTKVVQDIDEWSRRDYDRPFADPKSGMLPPKVARMMVNLANKPNEVATNQILLDPFCGMGTILAEAMLLGWQVIGSDIAATVITKTKANLNWLKSVYPHALKAKFQLMVADATHISDKIAKTSIDAIVTEPYMGSAFIQQRNKIWHKGKLVTPDKIQKILSGLSRLYRGCFREWKVILKPHAEIIIAIPEILFLDRIYRVKNLIDTCENLGYTLTQGPLLYHRPNAIVRRAIYRLEKK